MADFYSREDEDFAARTAKSNQRVMHANVHHGTTACRPFWETTEEGSHKVRSTWNWSEVTCKACLKCKPHSREY